MQATDRRLSVVSATYCAGHRLILSVQPTSKAHMQEWYIPDKPDAIYGALVGGLIALIVATLTNRHARKRQVLDLAHQAEQKERERIHSLKRDTYLPLLEASSSAIGFVAQIPTASIEAVRTQEPLVALGRQVARLALIAPPSVMEPVNIGFRYLFRVATELLGERLSIEGVAGDLATTSSRVQWHLDHQKDQNERFERLMDSESTNQPLFDHIQSLLSVSHEKIQELLSRQNTLIAEKARMELDLGRKAAASLRPMTEHTTKSLVAIRAELGLPIDAAWLAAFQSAQADEAFAILTKLQDTVTSHVNALDT